MNLFSIRSCAVLTSIVLSVFAGASFSHATPPLFEAPWRAFDTGVFPAGFAPKSIAVGDLDGDGDLDAVVGNYYFGGSGISVVKNTGDGTYELFARYATPINTEVNGVALLDVDGDGDLDVVGTVTNFFGTINNVGLWRNNGDGSFGTRIDFTVGAMPMGILVGDFTGDSFPDVVSANLNGNSISLLKHNGLAGPSASFLPAVTTAAGKHSEHLAAGDLNGDGKLDLVVGGFDLVDGYSPGIHYVMLNNGTGGFTLTNTYTVTAPPIRGGSTVVALADLNNDGKLDLVGDGAREANNIDFGVIAVRLGTGDGTFGATTEYHLTDWVWIASDITSADLNNDGFQDLIVSTPTGRNDDGYNVLLNNKTGGFETAVFYPAAQQTFGSVAADVDKDGDPDIVTVAESSSVITVHLNPGTGIFARPTEFPLVGFTEAEEMADVDGDGDLDVVVNDDQVRILKSNGNGTFAPYTTYTPPGNYADMKLRDLNGDGAPDLVLGPDAEFPPYHFATALNNGNGTFAPGVVTVVNSCGEGSIDAFDLDNDGDRDIVLTEEEGCGGSTTHHIFLFRNDGAAHFTAVAAIVADGTPIGIDAADTNGDGKLDLITSEPGGLTVYLGNGDLTFAPLLRSSTAPYKFKAADFNRDGKVDVAMIVPQPSFGTLSVGIALGNGDGTFQAVKTQSGASVLEAGFLISHDIDVADMNGDGILDLVVTNDASNDISLFLTNPDATLQPHQRYGAGYNPGFSVLGDFTGDGAIDVATVYSLPPSGFEDVLVVLPAIGTQPPNEPPTVAITRPKNNAKARSPVRVSATAADSDGSVTQVEFLADGVVFATATTPPYSGTLTTAARRDPYILTARATDNLGLQTTSAPVSITIKR